MAGTSTTSEYGIEPLGPDTWDAFQALVERHNGVFGGCWCTWFHTMQSEKTHDADDNRDLKKRLVTEGRAHAALVMDGDRAVAWCQYGVPEELPNIYHRKEYDETTANPAPYRITCFFVDRDHRRQGVATAALHGALDLIARGGGGLVEAFPMNGLEKKTSSSFLYSGLRSTFEAAGFEYQRPIGTKRCVMTRLVTAA